MMLSSLSSLLFFFLSLCLFFCLAVSTDSGSYDVCVIGGGASGSASAVFLKDLGYSVKLIEKTSALGGHCNTVNFEAPNGETSFIDIGVQQYINTSNAKLLGLGQWSLDTIEFITRFVPASALLGPGDGSPASFNVNFLNGQVLNLPFNQTEFQIAFNTLFGFVSQFPWINTGERPDPMPAILLEPFSKFLSDNNLQALVDPLINAFTFSAGVGDLAGMSTLQGVWYLSQVNLLLASGQPYSAITFNGGCQQLFNGIASHLGNSVTYNAAINYVHRSTNPAVIKGVARSSHGRKSPFSYSCNKIIVAVYPLLQNLAPWFDLTEKESGLFSNMVAQGYLALATTFTNGPLTVNQSFLITNFDPTQQYNLPAFPNLGSFQRFLPYGPAAAWVNAETTCTSPQELLEVAQEQFAGVPSDLLQDIRISTWNYHQYGPHWTTASESQSPSPNTRLKNLQGSHNTYWVGSGAATEGSHVVWNHAYKLITENFPSKN